MDPENNNEVLEEKKPAVEHPGRLAAIVFIALAVLIGLYLYGAVVANNNSYEAPEFTPSTNESNEPSDELDAIEAEFESFNPEALEVTDPEIESDLETGATV